MSADRKPHAGIAGYVCERKARLGGHVVVYDRRGGFDCDAAERWILQHEPSGRHVAIQTERQARAMMQDLAGAGTLEEAQAVADLFPRAADVDEDLPAAAPRAPLADADRQAALERFLADPENEPTAEGLQALRRAFGLDKAR